MIRRLVLLLALLVPAAGLAQTAGVVLIVPAAFGRTDCTSTTTFVTLTWTSSAQIVTGDKYRVFVNNSLSCPTTGTPSGNQLGNDFDALTATQDYPGTLTRSEFITKSSASCATGASNSVIYVCVQHVDLLGAVKTTAKGNADLNLSPPPKPVNVSVKPGNGALYVSWADGDPTGVAAATYEVTAVAHLPPDPGDVQTPSFTGKVNNKVTGLTNGVEYEVTVKAVAAGSTASAPSDPAYGTPQPTASFWDQYQDNLGQEQGGCDGGPAGLLSLLGVALALRASRRRA